MFKLWPVFRKRPLTPREKEWRNRYAKGSPITYMGVDGLVVLNYDLYENNMGRSDEFDGPAFITMRYLDNGGRFCEIELDEDDLEFDSPPS